MLASQGKCNLQCEAHLQSRWTPPPAGQTWWRTRHEKIRKMLPFHRIEDGLKKSSLVCQELLSHKKLTKEAAPCDWPMDRSCLDCRSTDGYLSNELSDSVRWGWHQKRMDSLKMGEFMISSFRSGAPHRRWIVGAALMLSCSEGKKHWTHFKTQSRVLDRMLTSGIKPEFMLEKMAMSTSFGPQIWLILALKQQINGDIMMSFADGFLLVCAEP